MSSIIGNVIKVSVFGESHGSHIGVTIDSLPAGIKLDFDLINKNLERRRGLVEISTSRREKDEYQIISGYFNDRTTGTPLTFLIKNKDVDDSVYDSVKSLLRPGHADLTAYLKYSGYQDYRGGGHFSGRLTTCFVIAGSIAMQLLKQKGINIGSRIKQIYDIEDDPIENNCVSSLIESFNEQDFPTISSKKQKLMKKRILEIREEKDSLGGIIETFVDMNGVVIGSPLFNSVEAKISSYLFSIGGLKGISFGKGFEFASLKGSEANDQYITKDNEIISLSNNNGGINGGISSGTPITISSVIKPTPSISKKQQSVDFSTKKNVDLEIKGRHDPCIAPRALYCINCMVALAILDLYAEENGINSLRG